MWLPYQEVLLFRTALLLHSQQVPLEEKGPSGDSLAPLGQTASRQGRRFLIAPFAHDLRARGSGSNLHRCVLRPLRTCPCNHEVMPTKRGVH